MQTLIYAAISFMAIMALFIVAVTIAARHQARDEIAHENTEIMPVLKLAALQRGRGLPPRPPASQGGG